MQIKRKSETIRFFDDKSSIWDKNYLDKKNPIAKRSKYFYEHIKSFSDKNLKILDVGCGTGDISAYLYDKGNYLTSLDVSKLMLEKASSRFSDKNIKWIEIEESGNLPLESSMFDTVIISSVLEYHKNPKLLISESYRVLKKNGLLIFTVPDMRHPIRIKEEKLRFLSKFPFWLFIKFTKYRDFYKTLKISQNRMPLNDWIVLTESFGFKCEFDEIISEPLKYISALKKSVGD
tara:strand:+ start:1900 stop:2598 length:699 start_codon:yes stop_codon:yes gene_type:complete